ELEEKRRARSAELDPGLCNSAAEIMHRVITLRGVGQDSGDAVILEAVAQPMRGLDKRCAIARHQVRISLWIGETAIDHVAGRSGFVEQAGGVFKTGHAMGSRTIGEDRHER